MLRKLVLAGPVAMLAGCGPAAEESDQPGITPAPTPSAVATAPAPPPPPGALPPPPQAFRQCATCHRVEPGARSIGPSLAGVFGAKAGHVGNFAYSSAMRGSGLVWDEATLDAFLGAPAQTLPGTKMSYAGLKDPAQRQAVIAYLKTL